MASWWYIADNQRQGPVTLPTLKKLLQHRVIGEESFVWRKGLQQWTPISKLDEFKPQLADIPPPLPIATTRHVSTFIKPVINSRHFIPGLIMTALLLTAGTSVYVASQKTVLHELAFLARKSFSGMFVSPPTPIQSQQIPKTEHQWQNPYTLKQADIGSGWVIKPLDINQKNTTASSFISEDIVANLSVAPAQNQTLPQLVDYLKSHEPGLRFVNAGVFARAGDLANWTGIATNPNDQRKNFVVHVTDAKNCYGILIAVINQQTAANVSRLEALIAALDNTFLGN